MLSPTTGISTLSLHDALPIFRSLPSYRAPHRAVLPSGANAALRLVCRSKHFSSSPASRSHSRTVRSEEHTSELQSLRHLVCRLLLEKKKKNRKSVRPKCDLMQ